MGPCFLFLQSRAKLCLRNFFLFPEYSLFHLKWPKRKPTQEGADMGGAASVHKKGWVLVGDGEAFPQGRARSSRRCSWCWQRALFAWGRPGEILSDHQHGHSAGRSKMQLIRENLFHSKASEQPHPCRGTAEQKATE